MSMGYVDELISIISKTTVDDQVERVTLDYDGGIKRLVEMWSSIKG